MRPLAAAFALALVCACMGATHGDNVYSDGGNGIGNTTLDGGGDGGLADGGDGGADAGDGGCTALSLNTASVTENCTVTTGASGTASLNVNGSTCTVALTTNLLLSCNGVASGIHDAFDGGCGSFSPCYSASLPGTIICAAPGTTSCTIVVDGGP